MFQMGGIGPMLGQAHHFRNCAPERIQYAYDRYTNEAGRLYRVVDRRLEESPWTAGNQYGIVDMAIFPWLRSHKSFEPMPGEQAVVRGVAVLADRRRPAGHSKEAWEIMFGAKQYEKR